MLRLMQLDPDPEPEAQVMVTIVIMCIHVLVEERIEVDTTILLIQELQVQFIDPQDLAVVDQHKLPRHQEEVLRTVGAFVVLLVHPEALEVPVVVLPVGLAEPRAVVEVEDKISHYSSLAG